MHSKESSGSGEFVVLLSKQTFQWDFRSKWLSPSPSAMTHYGVPSPRIFFSRSVGDNSVDRRSGCPVDQGLFGGKKSKPAKGHQISCKNGFSIWNFRMIEGVWYTCSLWHCIFSSGVLLTWLVLEVSGLSEVMVGPTVFQKFRLKICGVPWWWMVKTWMWRSKSCNLHYKFIQSQLVQDVIHDPSTVSHSFSRFQDVADIFELGNAARPHHESLHWHQIDNKDPKQR